MRFRPGSVPADANAPAPRVVGVKRLSDYLKRKLEGDPQLRSVSVRGEISNLNHVRSGNVHFDLKEGEALLHCFAWASDAPNFPALKNGIAVVATGSVTTYAGRSTYQLGVTAILLEGVGNIHALFEERKRKLAADGIFDPGRKRPLPAFPFRIALVSSRTANGAIDFVTLLRERAPHVRVVWCETSVQGPGAPHEICAALRRASAADVDVIVVTRGGGSFEDLFAFSDEAVVRAVARARHPVLSAIGHTADQQLCDFAADAHVETPSAAAKSIGPATRDTLVRLRDDTGRARRAVGRGIERLETRLRGALVRSKLADPRSFLRPLSQRVDDAETRLTEAAAAKTRRSAERLRTLVGRLDVHDPSRRLAARAARLQVASLKLDAGVRRAVDDARRRRHEALGRLERAASGGYARHAKRLEFAQVRLEGNSPERLLQQGYAIVTHRGAIVRDPAAVPLGEVVEARLAHGTLSARVEREESDGNQRIG
jgi:exodeoxyribonuclease VII large subunit